MPSVAVSYLLQAAPKTLAINAKFGQPTHHDRAAAGGARAPGRLHAARGPARGPA
jgi:hypothetical protein